MSKEERLRKAFEYLRNSGIVHTQKDVANAMGATPPNVSSAFKGETKVLTDSFINRFNVAFDNVFNEEWLLTGEGEMLNSSKSHKEEPSVPVISYTSGRPYYNIDFIGGFDMVFCDSPI